MNTAIKKTPLSVSLYSVLFGLVVGALIMLAFGYNPLQGYTALLSSALGSTQDIGEVLRAMTPLILTALGFTVASSAGFFNIGLSGQALAGWLIAVWFALVNPGLSAWLLIPGALILGTLAGAVAGAIPGWLRAQFGASEVIVTIMMNYIILFVTNNTIQTVMSNKIKDNSEATKLVGDNASLKLDWLTNLTQGSSISSGIFISLLVLVLIWFVMNKTTLGFEIRAVGLNPDAARYSGISAKRTAIVAMAISGGLAGLAGTIEGLGNYGNIFVQNSAPDIGFNGMSVALLGNSSYLGILAAAALFSILQIGGLGMPQISGVPFELVNIIIASIIFFVGANYLIRLLQARVKEFDEKSAAKEAAKKAEKQATKGGA